MTLTKSELKEMIREALREELAEGIFDKKVPEGTVEDYKYSALQKELKVFIQPTKGIHKNATKPLKYVFSNVPLDLASRMGDSPEVAQQIFDSELRSGKYKFKKMDYGYDGGWRGNKYGKNNYD